MYILETIKKLLGLNGSDTFFDKDIIIAINTSFLVLDQIGVTGKIPHFMVTDHKTKWNDFLDESPLLEAVKQYVYLKTRSIFDPPFNSVLSESYKRTLNELESRLSYMVDNNEVKCYE